MKKRNIVEWAMHYRQIIIMITACLMAFGVFGLAEMKKNEFPDFTIRQGIVIAVCPGANASEIEEQVTKPLEDYIFSYKEVKKAKTVSTSKSGIVVIQVQLNDNLNDKDTFWSKFKHGISQFKNELPQGVVAVQVMDDFGDTSALLITMESEDKTYRELNEYMDDLKEQLRKIEDVGRLTVYGTQQEQIAIYLDNEKLSHYGISDQTLALTLFTKGYTTSAGRVKTDINTSPIYVKKSMNTLRDVQEMIIMTDHAGNTVRLKNIAKVVKEYPKPESYIANNGKKCILLSVEIKKDKNVVSMGKAVKEEISKFETSLPNDVDVYKITDQSEVVDNSVSNFLMELLVAIAAVVAVVMLLLPFRVALVAASTIPITISISLGLLYAFGFELNTVSLAALIVTLGMIVDNSIVIIDSYLEKLSEGMSRWHAAIESATHFFKSIFSATLAISVTFFPFLLTMTGTTRDFLSSFPWATTIILTISLLVAELLVPFLLFCFIRKPISKKLNKKGKKPFSFLDTLQTGYNKLVDLCFAWPRMTIAMGVLSVFIGIVMIMKVPQKLLPTAQRNQFAVEIFMPVGTSLEKTILVADSMEHILRQDERILSVTSFKGSASPRFQNSYAPQAGGSNFAQFIVNTPDNKTTVKLLNEYSPKYSNFFPEAVVRFKQLAYSEAVYPVEVRLSCDDLHLLKQTADSVLTLMRTIPELTQVRTNYAEPLSGLRIDLDEDASTRLGVNNAMLEATMAMRYGSGMTVATAWEGDYDINIVLKSTKADSASNEDIKNELIPVAAGLANIPLRQIADIVPIWEDGQIIRRNGVRTITIHADMKRGYNAIASTTGIQEQVEAINIPDNIKVSYGGEYEENIEQMPNIIAGLCIAIAIIFFILLFHFKRVNTAVLLLVCLTLCVFGTGAGLLIQGVDFGVTCFLGIVSLMGILVRNSIIMIDYAEELRINEKMHVREAIYTSAQRRMRPIFLTSAAASMGVIPMILGGDGLWMPMGTVIFYGTLITMFLILTVIPVAYWLVMKGSTKSRAKKEKLELQ